MYPKLAFIGAGNMANAMVAGLIANKWPAHHIYLSNPSSEKLIVLQQTYGIHIDSDNAAIAKQAEVVILAVKPQILLQVVEKLSPIFKEHNPLIMSIAAGISTEKLAACCGKCPIIRCMPNTPSAIQQGMSGVYANPLVTDEQRRLGEKILSAIGKTLWVKEEDDINKITAISGSGPAYFFYFMEALQMAAEKMGFNASDAKQLILQSALGAVQLAAGGELPFATLRENVTSRGGTTEAALAVLQEKNLARIVEQTVNAALARGRELN